jgi:hypothetical protein
MKSGKLKKLIIVIFITLMTSAISAQKFDTIAKSGYTFPIKSKLTLKLVAVDSLNYKFYILHYEPFNKIIDTYANEKYLSKPAADNTIEVIFCVSTEGKTKEEKQANYKSLLLIKNGTKFPLEYRAKMKVSKSETFQSTSVVTIYPNAKNMEMWPYLIEKLALLDFKKSVK